ncbi:hypothetical protein [Limnohabitans sp.]|uniref:beta strand repeat-containing protein n=1 Tax=Limnohabitans sp. TaxID=1907725 RepID=UPI00286F3BE3|nr:hypothetical protein [Limnohabitans sp.]
MTTSAGNGFGVTAARVTLLTNTDDATPTLSGALNQSFDSATEELAIWSMNNGVNTKLGTASVTGSTWTFTPTTDMASGDYTFKAMVQAKGNNTFSAGRLVSATTNTVVINTALSSASTGVTIASLIDNDAGTGATVSSGSVGTPVTTALTAGTAGAISTDDATPTLTGNVGRALATGESLVLYDTYNGVTTKVGSTTAGSGLTTISTAGSGATTTWTFAPSASVGAGQHKYSAVVENALGVQGTPTAQNWVNVYDSASRAAMTINYVDSVAGANASTTGTVSLATPSFTDDARPSFSGNLPSSFALGNNEELALYKNVAGVYTLIGRSGASTLAITGTAWTVAESAATDLVAGQSTSYVLMVQTTGSTNATAGKVVSASSGALIYSTTAPSQTTTITTVADNEVGTGLASTQATDTFTKDTGGLPIAVSKDDATPTLAGTISTALYAGQQLAVYDTVNGVTTKVAGTVTGLTAGTGTAIGTGTSWTFTPTSNLSAGKHSFTARVESGTGEFAAYSTDARVVNVHTGLTMSLADDVGKTRTVSGATGMTTDDNLPTMSGILSADLGANEELAVYSSLGGAAYVRVTGTATVTGTSWTFTPSAILADGTYTFKAMVHDKSDVSATGVGRVVSVQSGAIVIDTASAALLTQTTTITGITDDLALNGSLTGTVGAGTTTDDTTPVLTGTISAVLAANQNVVVYDTVNGVTTQVAGTVTGVTVGTGTSWTFTPTTPLTAAQAGTHSFTARVENANSGAQAAVSNAYAVKVFTAGLDVSVTDNVGALQGTANYAAGVSSDDTTPTLSGSLSTVGGLSTGDEVAVYQTLNGVTTFAGVASVTGSGASLAWSYTPGTPLGVGDYTFKAMVQPTGDMTGAAGKVVATSQIVKVGATDTTFDAITSTTDTNVTTSSFKALSVASQMALDMNAYTHADFDVLNLQASATAKIDLADVVQGAKNLFTTAKFTTVSGAGLGDTTLLGQFLVNGNDTNALTFAGPATTWTNSGVVSNSGHQYDVYTSGISQLLIDKDVVNRTGFTVI